MFHNELVATCWTDSEGVIYVHIHRQSLLVDEQADQKLLVECCNEDEDQ